MGRPIKKQVLDGIYPSYETFKSFYIDNNHTINECINNFNLSKKQIINLINYFNLHKDSEQSHKNCVDSKIKNKNYPTKDQLISDYYKYHNWESIRIKYNIPDATFKRLRYRLGLKKEINKILENKNLLITYIESFNKKISVQILAESLGVLTSKVYYWCEKHEIMDLLDHNTSNPERILKEKLNNISFKKNRSILKPYEIDLYSSEKKVGIEYNGLYWHSNNFKNKDYHLNKSLLALKNNIYLIHIYEEEFKQDNDRILNFLLNVFTNNILCSVEECEIKEIKNIKDVYNFINRQYRNKFTSFNKINVIYGLYYNNILQNCICFRKKNKDIWEIIIDFPEIDNKIKSSYKKILESFIKKYKPKQIIISNDFNKYNGSLYVNLNFKLNKNIVPNIVYEDKKNNISVYGSGFQNFCLNIDSEKLGEILNDQCLS